MFKIGLRIKDHRKAAKYTQKELGQMLGVNRDTVTRFEMDASKITIYRLFRIAEVLEVEVGDLMGLDGEANIKLAMVREMIK